MILQGKKVLLSFTVACTEQQASSKGAWGDMEVLLWPLQVKTFFFIHRIKILVYGAQSIYCTVHTALWCGFCSQLTLLDHWLIVALILALI